jgi:hypothetical protein
MADDNTDSWMGFAQRSRDDGGLGLEPHQAAGLVGNLQNESGSSIPAWGPSGDNGSAWGTAQWRGDRLDNLKQFAANNGLDHTTVEAQQAFMRHEFDTTENKSYRALQAAQTPEDAAAAVNTQYERSADHSGRREQSARALMDGPTAIDAAMGRTRPTGSQAMAYADDGSTTPPALAPQQPPGALQNGGQPVPPPSNDWLQVLGQTLKNMAPGIAQDPAHAQVLQASADASAKANQDQGTWSHITLPNGQIARINSKQGIPQVMDPNTGEWKLAAGNYAADDKTKWGITGKDKYGQPVYGYPPTPAEFAAQKTAAPAPDDAGDPVKLTGQPFMDQLTKDRGAGYQAQVQAVLEGRAPYPTGMFLKTEQGQRIAQDVTQADPSFETGNATARVKVRNEFKAGGNSSPAGQILAGNTAIKHAGEMSDSLEEYKAAIGDHEGAPALSYGLNIAANAASKGTKGGSSLGDFRVARDHFAEEAAKFYSGSGGSEAERARAISNLDEAKSLPELRSVIRKEAALMKEKVDGLQERWRTGMGPLVADYPLIQPKSTEALDRIEKRFSSSDTTSATPGIPKKDRPPLSDIFK